MTVTLDSCLTWRDVASVADGAQLTLSQDAWDRLATAREIVEAIVDRGMHVYGINTGVGALCDVVVARDQQRALSRNIVLSHAVGMGADLPQAETRSIMTAAVNNYAHGHSGVRPRLAEAFVELLNRRCTPAVPSQGSVGYISHMAHIGLVFIGQGKASIAGEILAARDALARLDLSPLVLDTKEGLSIVNGTPCATGLACLALKRAERLLDWADCTAALTFESLNGQITAFDEEAMGLQRSPGVRGVAARLRQLLGDSDRLVAAKGKRTQDALSLRAVPHVHGAARDAFDYAASVVDRELASVSDNPVVFGTPADPRACSTAHAVGAGVALAMDTLGTAIAEVAAMAERRIDRLVNPLVSGLPAFLVQDSGVHSGFMIAQYTAVSLVNENRRRAAPASLDGGVTSGLQEDHLSHATPASLKCLAIIENAVRVVGIELLTSAQASDLQGTALRRGRGTEKLRARIRAEVAPYEDDRPLGPDLERAACLVRNEPAPVP